jgi:general secretion pathway protein A
MAVHESLAQRIVVRHHLTGLTREELPEYLTHRLRWPAASWRCSSRPAIEALFQATQGMPVRSIAWRTMRSPAPPSTRPAR